MDRWLPAPGWSAAVERQTGTAVRRPSGRWTGLLAALGLLPAALLPSAPVRAQQAAAPAALARVPTLGPLVTDHAVPIPRDQLSVEVYAFLNITGGEFTADWERLNTPGSNLSLLVPVVPIYGPWTNTELQVIVPVVASWFIDVPLSPETGGGATSASFFGIGGISYIAKYAFLKETLVLPEVTAFSSIVFPTGSRGTIGQQRLRTDVTSAGVFTYIAGFNSSKWLLRHLVLYLNLWYSVSATGEIADERVRPRDSVIVNLAAELPLIRHMVLVAEILSAWSFWYLIPGDVESPPTALVTGVAGIEVLPSYYLAFEAGVLIDLVGKNLPYRYTPALAAIVTFNL